MTASTVDIALFAAKLGMVFFVILTLAAYLVFAERRVLAWISSYEASLDSSSSRSE